MDGKRGVPLAGTDDLEGDRLGARQMDVPIEQPVRIERIDNGVLRTSGRKEDVEKVQAILKEIEAASP